MAGVRKVGVLGGSTPEVEVRVNPRELSAYGLTLTQVSRALAQTNVIRGIGRLEDNDLLYLAISNNAFHSIASVRNVALRAGPDGVVRLGQIATITMGSVPRWLIVDDNGHPGVNINVYQQSSADSLRLAQEVKRKLAAFMRTEPPAHPSGRVVRPDAAGALLGVGARGGDPDRPGL
ncbi:Acriflavin resistance protein, partial [mine drainage metagenome]